MKQILALMTFLFVLMLMITTVMAVGNAKQSEMMTQRAQLITSLRAELRSEKQEKKELTGQLEQEQTMVRSLRKERDTLNQRLNRLMLTVRSQPVGFTDASVKSQPSFGDTVPLWSVQAAMPRQGEEWLQVQALENTLAAMMAQRMAESSAKAQNVTAVAAHAAQNRTTPAATSAVISFAPATTQPPKPAPTPAPVALTARTEAPAPTVTPAPTATPAGLPLLAQAAGNALSRMNQLLRWLEETLCQFTEKLTLYCQSDETAAEPISKMNSIPFPGHRQEKGCCCYSSVSKAYCRLISSIRSGRSGGLQ